MNKFPHKPLIFNIAWKSSIYFLATFLVHYIEHLIGLLWEYGGVMGANRHLLGEINWPHFWLVQMWLAVLFLVYCSLQELVRALGKEQVIRLFLGRDTFLS